MVHRKMIPLLALFITAVAGAQSQTQSIVDQIDTVNYRHYLDDLLYTHLGDNRGFGLEHDLARANIEATFQSFGLAVSLDPFTYQFMPYYNVVAVKNGLTNPSRQFIIGAHFDSVGNPGADDNGSGTAGVMEIARVLSGYDFESTIIFIAFDREEQGLIGSDAYAIGHQMDDIRGMVSMDMIAYNTGADAVELYGRAESGALKTELAQAVLDYSGGLGCTIFGPMDASDHAPFEWQGFQASLIIEDWGNPFYHTPNDHVDMPVYIDYDYASKVCRAVCGWLVDQAVLIEVTCAGDVNGDGAVNVPDLLTLLAAWGTDPGGPPDFDGDGLVAVPDLLLLLAAWGPCP